MISSHHDQTEKAPRAAVIGWPVKHSRSPIIHRHWLKIHGIAGSYDLLPLQPEAAESFFRTFAASGLIGANVTIPHKEAAFALCDEVDETARLVGAVNTLVLGDGRLQGSNTDGLGFLGSLDSGAPGWDETGRNAVVLGAGGGARAVVWALLSRGLTVHIFNRTRSRAEALAERFGSGVHVHDFSKLPDVLEGTTVLVNTTSLGMEGQPPLDIDLAPLPARAVVTDTVYVPLETPLLELARHRGLMTVDGLGMLLHQAVPGFELWFGRRPEVTPELRRVVLADMGLTEGDMTNGNGPGSQP
ncbi:shikimate dehydrogenase [Breoghania corrubedonensis]|uniref:Shikimate dehydrogenase (NADP(+)) n=1 Tax=Breoghania corrubedonensis TaxID=665038 RepID=A0A2T5VHQ8_9HYPH|nr:shikimate dehydrogenase [Breoghania corrubedonensis]PTW63258.1 shikimate dehydrogenase [Breoghania corrubedonensis]